MSRSLAPLLFFLASTGCFSDAQSPPDCICTTEFVSIQFVVVDDSGQPLPDVKVQVLVQRTGEALEISQDQAPAGIFTVANDSHISQLRATGETLVVQGSLGTRSFSENFEVSAPGECKCHVAKVAGPDTVVVGRGDS